MKLSDKYVFFEDSDSVQQIKTYFKELLKKERELESREHGVSDLLGATSLTLTELIAQIELINFTTLNDEEVAQVKALLKKEESNISDDFQNFFSLKIIAGLSLIDFISRNIEKYPHELTYSKEYDIHIGEFSGVFEKELQEIQIVLGDNPISFYVPSDKTPPILDFSKSFSKIANIIKRNFIADMSLDEFNSILANYSKFKQS